MKLPNQVFKHPSLKQQVESEADELLFLDKVEVDKGIYLYIKDTPFPSKGYPSAETIVSLNMAKKNIIEMLKIMTLPVFWLGYLFFFFTPLKKKVIQQLIASYNRISYGIMSPFLMKDEYTMAITQELRWFIESFLIQIGISEVEAERFADMYSHLIEYDNAYRFRIQDIFSETSEEALYKKPIREVYRLFKIYKQRDHKGLHSKFAIFFYGIAFMLLLPKYRKAFKQALLECDFKKFQFDESDQYWISMREDYLYEGKTKSDRMEVMLAKGYTYPQGLKL
jgi:hypothetical protein